MKKGRVPGKKPGKPVGKNADKKILNTAIAARGRLCFAGSVGVALPCARPACMKTNGGLPATGLPGHVRTAGTKTDTVINKHFYREDGPWRKSSTWEP